MSYQLYRNTTLGHTLQESLDELIQVRCHFTPKNRNLNPLRCNSSHNISLCQQAVRLAPVIFGVSPSRVSLVDCKPYTCCIWNRQGGLTPHMINLVRKIYVLINDKYWEKIIKVISMTRNFLKRIKTNYEISIKWSNIDNWLHEVYLESVQTGPVQSLDNIQYICTSYKLYSFIKLSRIAW